MIRKFTIGVSVTAVAVVATTAFAADLPSRVLAPAAPLADQAYDWGGFYIGGHAGYHSTWAATSRSYSDAYSSPSLPGSFPIISCAEGCGSINSGYTLPIDSIAHARFGSMDAHRSGFAGGVQIGYNFHVARNFVFGFEGDVTFLNGKQTSSASNAFTGSAYWSCDKCTPDNFFGGTPYNWTSTGAGMNSASTTVEQSWLSTLRARAGLAFDRLLVFGTGGLAFAKVKVSSFDRASYTLTPDSGGNNSNSLLSGATTQTWSGAATENRLGFSIGGGAEYALTRNWLLRGEYLYYNLGSITQSLRGVTSESGVVTYYGGYIPVDRKVTTKTNVDGALVKAALSYKF